MPARRRSSPPRGNYQRAHFDAPEIPLWRCLVCGAPPERAHHWRGETPEAMPYNLNQQTCSPSCARRRKTDLQRERRQEKRREGLATSSRRRTSTRSRRGPDA